MKINGMRLLCVLILITPMCKGALGDLAFFAVVSVLSILLLQYFRGTNIRFLYAAGNVAAFVPMVSALLLGYCVINIGINGLAVDAIIRILQLYTAVVTLFLFSIWRMKKTDYLFIARLMQGIIWISFLMWPFSGFTTNYYSALFNHSNPLAAALLCYFAFFSFVPIVQIQLKKTTFLLLVILLYVANSRTTILACLIFLVLKFLFLKFDGLKKTWAFLLMVMSGTFFPIFYVYLYNSAWRVPLNVLSQQYFRKNFFSGRQYLWAPMLEAIAENSVWGYGLQATPEDLIGVTLSSHNWHLQILFQMGIFGYFLLVFLLWIVWKQCSKHENVYVSACGCAFIIGILFTQCFVVSLTQNNFSVGLLAWLLFGVSINAAFGLLNFKSKKIK